jgi:hypothetical protein
MGHAGSDWIESNVTKEISEHGRNVADLLGDVFLGIYHLNRTSLGKVNWENKRYIDVTVRGVMSTYDDDLMTRLVVLAFDRMMRVEIVGLGPLYLRLTFYQRKTRKGTLMERVPTLEDHVKSLRDYYGDPTA